MEWVFSRIARYTFDALSEIERRDADVRIRVRTVVHTTETEAEQAEETGLVALEIAEFCEIVGADHFPALADE